MNFVHQPEDFQLYVVASCLEGDAKRKMRSEPDNTLVFTDQNQRARTISSA